MRRAVAGGVGGGGEAGCSGGAADERGGAAAGTGGGADAHDEPTRGGGGDGMDKREVGERRGIAPVTAQKRPHRRRADEAKVCCGQKAWAGGRAGVGGECCLSIGISYLPTVLQPRAHPPGERNCFLLSVVVDVVVSSVSLHSLL